MRRNDYDPLIGVSVMYCSMYTCACLFFVRCSQFLPVLPERSLFDTNISCSTIAFLVMFTRILVT